MADFTWSLWLTERAPEWLRLVLSWALARKLIYGWGKQTNVWCILLYAAYEPEAGDQERVSLILLHLSSSTVSVLHLSLKCAIIIIPHGGRRLWEICCLGMRDSWMGAENETDSAVYDRLINTRDWWWARDQRTHCSESNHFLMGSSCGWSKWRIAHYPFWLAISSASRSPALSVPSVCLSISSMLSSCREKKRPPDNTLYVKTCNKNPKKTKWWYHGKKGRETYQKRIINTLPFSFQMTLCSDHINRTGWCTVTRPGG